VRDALAGWAAPDEDQERLRRAFLARLDDGPDAVRREGRPSHLTASAVVLDASGRSVLLVLHRRTGLWLQPGGHVEDGDASLAGAALREAVEETGIADLELLDERPVHLERHRAPCGAEHHLDVRFAVRARDGVLPTVSEESLDVAWHGLDALPVQRGVELRALVTAAVRAQAVRS
jgi:8-oxo-dGTP pyrophosphatase MutT (NUDIX family)